jgi:HEPN domain-containing protein
LSNGYTVDAKAARVFHIAANRLE